MLRLLAKLETHVARTLSQEAFFQQAAHTINSVQ